MLHCTCVCLLTGLLEEHTLRCCQKVCRYWQHLAKETMEEFKFRRKFQEQIQTIMNVGCFVCLHESVIVIVIVIYCKSAVVTYFFFSSRCAKE